MNINETGYTDTRKDFLPIILGSDENAYGDVRMIREKYDVTPLIVCKRLLIPTMYSRLFDYITIDGFDKDGVFPDAMLKILHEKSREYRKLVVIACSDYYSMLMSKYYDRMEGLIANRFNSFGLLEKFDTKDKFYRLCDECGIDYPKTVVCEKNERVSAVDNLPFDFPIIVKPENSNAVEYLSCKFTGKKKVYKFESREEYLALIKELDSTEYCGKLIIQEFIPGGDDCMRVVNSYSDNDGRVVFSCLGQPLLEEYSPYTLGNYAAIISRCDEEVYKNVGSFLDKIGYVGFSNIDMKFDAKSGKYMFFEINPRLGRSSYFVRAAGYNMMEELIEDVVYGRKKNVGYSKTEALWSNVPLGILKKYMKNDELRREAMKMKNQCVFTLKCREDRSLMRFYRITRYYLTNYKNYRLYCK